MPQFTIYENINEQTKNIYPYLLDVQNDLLEGLNTRVVIPLCKSSVLGKRPINNLSPQIEIQGSSFTLLTPQLAGIAISDLGPAVGSLSEYRFDIINALDFLFTGFWLFNGYIRGFTQSDEGAAGKIPLNALVSEFLHYFKPIQNVIDKCVFTHYSESENLIHDYLGPNAMTKADKKNQKIRINPNNIKFQDFISWLEDNGFSLDRVIGSHHIFMHPEIETPINA